MKKFMSIFMLFFATILYAAPSPYRAILEVQGAEARLHVFQYDSTVHEIFSEKTTITSSVENALKILLDDALPKVAVLPIALNIFSSDELPATISAYINSHYLNVYQLESLIKLSAEMKIFYHWLSINYLAQTLQNRLPVINAVDINEKGTAIAYSSDDASSADAIHFNFSGRRYSIIHQNFSSLGFLPARTFLLQDPQVTSCYPQDYPLNGVSGKFNLPQCRTVYQQWLQSLEIFKNPLATGKEPWAVFSEAEKVFEFFEIADPEKMAIENRIHWVCALPWNNMLQEYEGEPEGNLATICSNAIFVNELLHSVLRIPAQQIWLTTKINRQKIDWPLGAAVYLGLI